MLGVVLSGCSGCGNDAAPPNATEAPTPPQDEEGWHTSVSMFSSLPLCDVRHRGLLFDFGSPGMVGRYGSQIESPIGIVDTQHDGATWGRVYDRTVSLRFHLAKVDELFVSLRAIGHDSSRVNVAIDGYLLDVIKFGRDEAKVGRSRTTSLPVDAGLHTLQLRFRGYKRSDANPFAELDWLRIGLRSDGDRTYGPPTFEDVLDPQAALGGVPHRAISLRAPSSVMCTMRIPPHAQFRVAVGLNGDGQGTAAVLLHREKGDPVVLRQVDVEGGKGATWTDLDLPMHQYAGQLVGLELVTTQSTGGRIMFGDPQLDLPVRERSHTRKAKVVALVSLSGVQKRDLPPWRGAESPHLPTFGRLAKKATIFDDHRAPSTLVSSVMASLLSGLTPRETALFDPGAQLSKDVRTIGTLARNASVRSGMFTNVPTTFAPFGFASSWETFEAYPPNEGAAASAPLDAAAKFLTDRTGADGRPTFAVVHTRGGHPPWEVTPDEASKLPPDEYSGRMSPRRAAQQLAELDGRHSRLTEQDQERLNALFLAALSRQDRALGNFIRSLEEAELWDDTLLIVTGDVSSSLGDFFVDGAPLSEGMLTVPLYVHFPKGDQAGARVENPSDVYDLTRTLLAALDIKPLAEMRGHDLAAIAEGFVPAQRLRGAFLDDTYAVRWGQFVLRGKNDERPALCDLSVDPTCAYDHSDLHPRVTLALFRHLAHERITGKKPPERQPLTLDSQAAAWLSVWGAY